MNTQTRLSASRLIVMTLACLMIVCLAACGGDDSDEPAIDELLSDKTTPVTFQLPQGDYYMFDYSGSRYVGSDTIHVDGTGKYEIELRQGNHNILLVKYGDDGREYAGVIYDVATRRFLYHGGSQSLSYGWCEVDVVPYLLPTQKVELEYLTATLQIEPTDELPFTPVDKGSYLYEGVSAVGLSYRLIGVGKFTGLPTVQSVSANGSQYIFDSEVGECVIAAVGVFYSKEQKLIVYPKYDVARFMTICPKDGMNDIQLTTQVFGNDDKIVPTIDIPTFSMRRGYTTILRGPLFSGSTADWAVTMEPYKN